MKHLCVTTYRVSRSNCAPAYYQGRPASLLIKAMEPRRRRAVAGHGGRLAAVRVAPVCVTPTL
jgi:hypothetical protein